MCLHALFLQARSQILMLQYRIAVKTDSGEKIAISKVM